MKKFVLLKQFIFYIQEGLGNSSAMEVFALKSLLTFFTQNCGINTRVLVTDRSTSVRAMLQENFPDINHQFDIWYKIVYISEFLKMNIIGILSKVSRQSCSKPPNLSLVSP